MSKANPIDSSFLQDAAAISSSLDQEQVFRNQRIQSDINSEFVRLQNLNIFYSLKKTSEDIDSKPCQICKKGRKEILW